MHFIVPTICCWLLAVACRTSHLHVSEAYRVQAWLRHSVNIPNMRRLSSHLTLRQISTIQKEILLSVLLPDSVHRAPADALVLDFFHPDREGCAVCGCRPGGVNELAALGRGRGRGGCLGCRGGCSVVGLGSRIDDPGSKRFSKSSSVFMLLCKPCLISNILHIECLIPG